MNDFNQTRLGPDDPHLTAFALGELEGEENARVAAAVAADPALQAAVEEIRLTAARLTAALAAEPMPEPAPPARIEPYRTVRPARIFRLPYWGMAALAAAACLTVVVTLHRLPQGQRPAQPVLAEAGNPPASAAAQIAAGRVQPSNHVEIQFPAKSERLAGEELARTDDTEKWGAVLPNPPAVTVAASPAPPAGPAAEAPRRTEVVAPARAAERRIRPQLVNAGSGVSGGFARSSPSVNAESSDHGADNDFLAAALNPRSTFAVDVDTASYSNVRRFLLDGRPPPRDAVRIEELVNYFPYNYAAPPPREPAPFAASLEVASAPWAPTHRLVRIGLKGREAPAVIARDVQVQVEFNPAQVQAYRLIGYEHRPAKEEESGSASSEVPDVAAREIAAGRAVTALYEVIPVGVVWQPESAVDPLKYQQVANSKPQTPNSKPSAELLTVKVRYQAPAGGASRLLEFPLVDRGTAFAEASPDFKFAAAVAGFGLVLRDSPHKGAATLAAVADWADQGTGSDAGGYRAEFRSLVKRAEEVLAAHG